MSVRGWVIGAAGAFALSVAFALAWHLHGVAQYRAGAADTRAQIEAQAQRLAQAAQEERDRADAKYRGQILATEASGRDLAAHLADADGMLHALRRKLQAAETCSRLDDAGEDWIGILGASWTQYSDMAKEAARLADKVTGLQDYVRAVRSQKP